jgi:hypothetical protein
MTRVASVRRSFPTLVLLAAPVRWVGQSRRRILAAVLLILAIMASPPAWWAMQLIGLPDVGDPFDVAEFQKSTIADDRNAFVLYAQAATLLKSRVENQGKPGARVNLVRFSRTTFARWSDAQPEFRRWVEENREALAVYRRGALRPDALERTVGFDRASFQIFEALSSLQFMAFLEASRLEEDGDMAGAWGWYHAQLRTMHHIGMRGSIARRDEIVRWNREFRNRLMTWADDPRTTPVLLRQALDDVVACESLAPSEVDSLKSAYLDVQWLLDSPANPGRHVPIARFRRFWNPNYTLDPERLQEVWDWWRFLRREPERSRRVIRLITANWLAYFELPAEKRPRPDPSVVSLDFYALGPGAPAQARALAPGSLDAWFETAYDAQQVLRLLDGTRARTVERVNHVDLLVLLATELYHRDHGTDPPTPAALVGRYLKSLPADFLDDGKDRPLSGP